MLAAELITAVGIYVFVCSNYPNMFCCTDFRILELISSPISWYIKCILNDVILRHI